MTALELIKLHGEPREKYYSVIQNNIAEFKKVFCDIAHYVNSEYETLNINSEDVHIGLFFLTINNTEQEIRVFREGKISGDNWIFDNWVAHSSKLEEAFAEYLLESAKQNYKILY